MTPLKKLFPLFLCFLLAWSCVPAAKKQDRDIEKKITGLVSKMTLEEKIGQMTLVSCSNIPEDEQFSEALRKGHIGSVINEVDPARVNSFQKIAVEESRLGIPLIVGRDVIHGFKTIFPIPLGLAATFNPSLVEQGARAAAMEATSAGVRWTFSPMLDISRDPRWGRISEGFGEDTYLASVMGVAMIRGYQGTDPGDPTSLAACVKHFVGYGAAEGGRDYNSTFLPERVLRNVYLPPFLAGIQAGAMTLMTSFNDNDGVPMTGNRFLVRDLLRDEWNYNGFVVSDWASVNEMIPHGFAADQAHAARLALEAGVDMDMMSFAYITQLEKLIKEGAVSEKLVDEAVRNILRVKFLLGLFDNPYVQEDLHKEMFYNPHHMELSRQSAVQSAVLLCNDGTLPLDEQKIRSVLVTGPMADAPYDQLGTWVFDALEQTTATPLKAIREHYGHQMRVIYEPGLKYSRDKDRSGIRKAVASARAADVVIAFVGEESILSGEAHCLASLDLQGAQDELIEALQSTGKPVITVVMAGRPLTIEKEISASNALLYSFHPGTMGGVALADLIFGKEVPSGRLPVTFPKTTGQIPLYYNHNRTGRPFLGNETMLDQIPLKAGQTSLGNTSFYLDAGAAPLFPFGFGLSYTTFAYTNIRIDQVSYTQKDTLTLSFDLTNTGKAAATEVAQLYVCDKTGSVTRPVKELKRFERIALEPGETRSVSWELPISELAFWNLQMKRVVESGQFELWVAGDSDSGEPVLFEVNN
ncbi:MAG: beta-glucosidase BglX [Bacteroidales bacterium]|nr:beta-glucosidase BglX [Bacteroidales bacterium]